MRLLQTSHLSGALEHRLRDANQVDLAVAWATPGVAIDLLREAAQSGKKIRAIVGLDMQTTNPQALTSLREFADLRIGSKKAAGIFHPKFYLFYLKDHNISWVGSSNLTRGAYSSNVELVAEYLDNGEGKAWFDTLWQSLPKDPSQQIEEYQASWRPPVWPKKGPAGKVEASHPIRLLEKNSPKNWSDSGREIVLKRDWDRLSRFEIKVLLGLRDDDGAWGLLGSMRGAASAVSQFKRNVNLSRDLKRKITPLLETISEQSFLEASTKFIAEVREMPGFNVAVATRLISLARPDRGISVNGGSNHGLARLTGLPKTPQILANEVNYPRLLTWLYDQSWYRVEEPDEDLGKLIWSMRAALMDSFVYRSAED